MGNTPRFKNVALLPEDHEFLRELAALDQRTMTRQLSIIIRREVDMQTMQGTMNGRDQTQFNFK